VIVMTVINLRNAPKVEPRSLGSKRDMAGFRACVRVEAGEAYSCNALTGEPTPGLGEMKYAIVYAYPYEGSECSELIALESDEAEANNRAAREAAKRRIPVER
jgi:hypothetical protein